MEDLGLHVEASHHEVSTGGQCEIDFRFGGLMDVADQLQWYKYIVRNVAAINGKVATFMPKPIFSDNGSGMHQHYSLHAADGSNLFTGDSHAGLSEMGLYFVGGIIEHAHSILAFTNPLTNSYRRLVPGFEAPIFCAYSGRNRSAFIRILAATRTWPSRHASRLVSMGSNESFTLDPRLTSTCTRLTRRKSRTSEAFRLLCGRLSTRLRR